MEYVPFPLLVDPDYDPNTFNYDPAPGVLPTRAAWIDVFRHSIPEFASRAAADESVPDAAQRAETFRATFLAQLASLDSAPPNSTLPPSERLNCTRLCLLRDGALRGAGFPDCFRTVKRDENASALLVLPSLLAEVDAAPPGPQRLRLLVEGAFAGNIFDLGAANTADLHRSGGGDFRSTRGRLLPRPWSVDDFDALCARWEGAPHTHAILFVDNAGADFVLGMLPLARELARRGAAVIIASNEVPSINDMTAAEAVAVLAAAAEADEVLRGAVADGKVRVMSSGSAMPVFDLRTVSAGLAAAAAACNAGPATLVVMEGMGRGIETNLRLQLTCDTLNLGMIKHKEVAMVLGGPLYGCVCRFSPAPA